ncbi:Z1 domain-containing protein [Neisseria dumasiana]|uniref:Z1 domain-containing protein n=1 Tax=Neisseria dumasiana TaxID=1931275 RepID=UPI000A199633|nr:Z1 domain-containing protein [Neisseria dumasiana]OSI14371.1 DEAD/DEAH box helicase [Neisseria dumasiana]
MLQNYLERLTPPELVQSVQKTVNGFMEKLQQIKPKKAQNVLLLGNVQSGKTAQTLGVLSALADNDHKIFVYLTTDSVDLQKQTVERAKDSLDKFIVLSENDDKSFTEVMKADNPILVVIKKNASVLRRWRNLFTGQTNLKGYPLVIVDDEADAASLNTNADKKDKDASTINRMLSDIKNACCQSLFIQLTATPQSILLQDEGSHWQPEFVHYFEPGENYIGGKFVFSDPPNVLIARFIDNELDDMKDESGEIADGVRLALHSFLITCAEFELSGKNNCNFALHPSIKIQDHQAFADKIQTHLNELVQAVNFGEHFADGLQESYMDLQKTKPDIHHFEEIYEKLTVLLQEKRINILVLNSKTEADFDLKKGFNVIIGGNVIGRGLTIPKLQTVYYSRSAKKPNADTFWQHSRIFGYDRDKLLLRLYMPSEIYQFFATLNRANDLLIEQVCTNNGEIQMIYPGNINPTRKNVLKSGALNQLIGGVNYFPSRPNEQNLGATSWLVAQIRRSEAVQPDLYQLGNDELLELLQSLGDYFDDDWDKTKFISSFQALQSQRPSFKNYVLIKEERKLSRATGTMLSEDDRRLGEKYPEDLVLTLYKIVGDRQKGWQGQDFWLPNIKLPHKGMVYWSVK